MNLKQISANIRNGRILNVSVFTEEILEIKNQILKYES